MKIIKHPGFLIPLAVVALAGLWFALVSLSGADSNSLVNTTKNVLDKNNREKPAEIKSQEPGTVMKEPAIVAASRTSQEIPRWREEIELNETERSIEIAEHEDRIEREDAIQRLNTGKVTDAERKEYGKLFERLVTLKKVDIEIASAKIAANLHEITKNHKRNLALAGIHTQPLKRSN